MGSPSSLAETVSPIHLFVVRPIHLSFHVAVYAIDHHQLSIILDVLGTPSLDDFYAITSPRSREYIRALPFRKKKPFSSLFANANPLVSTIRPTISIVTHCCITSRLWISWRSASHLALNVESRSTKH